MGTTAYRLSQGSYTQNWTTGTTPTGWAAFDNVAGYGSGDATSAATVDPSLYTADFTTSNFNSTANGNPSAGGVYFYSGTNLDPTAALQGSGSQDYTALVFYLDASERQAITFSATLRDLDTGTDNTAQAIVVQYRVGGTGAWTNVPGGVFADVTTGPSTGGATNISLTLPEAANNQANLQIRVMTGNAPGSDELVGVDNVVIASTALPTGAPGSFAIANASVVEGNAGATDISFVVTRSGGSTGAADVAYSVAYGTASADDFAVAPVGGTLNFADGETSRTITYRVAGDTVFEANETFTVRLDSTTVGTITGATATGTIVNDDPAPAGSLAIAGAQATEGNTGQTAIDFIVTRANGSVGAVSADYAVAFTGTASANDLSGATSGTVSFADGETSRTIRLYVSGDTTFEANETFQVTLSNPQGGVGIATANATGTILNDDAAPPPAPLFINEINYDPTSADTGEAIEIAGPAGTSLAGWTLVLYNGNGGAVYDTRQLTGTIADQSNGYGTVTVTYGMNGIQNGSPDGIALVAPGGQVVQFLSYEGVMTATAGPAAGMTSTDIGVTQEGTASGFSLQLTGTGATYDDFSWTSTAAQNSFGSSYVATGTTAAQFAGAINAGQSFLPATGTGYVRIGDARVTEGDSGTQALTFTVTRSGGSAAAASVDYAVAFDGTASASDLAPGTALSGTLAFAVGEISKTITLGVVGDTLPEGNETLSVRLANPTGDTVISDGLAIGTIVNDDPVTLRIYDIQGSGLTSDYVGQRVTTTGIVTAVGTNGFYVQDAAGDGSAATSDAIFVATTARSSAQVGDAVTVTGSIAEVGASGALTVTQFAAGATVAIGTHDNALPAAVLIGTSGINPPTASIPAGIALYEALEGMRVSVDAPLVVARTEGGETWTVASGGAAASGVNAHGGITISAGDFNPERILLDSVPDLFAGFTGSYAQGDRLSTATGILTYGSSSDNSSSYRLTVTGAVTQTFDANLAPETTTLVGDATHLTIASFNMENLDPGDGAQKFNLLASNVVYNLRAPDIIFAQEIQDADGAGGGSDLSGQTTANTLISAIRALDPSLVYSYVEVAPTASGQTGGEPGGNIRNGFFYRADRVSYVTDSAALINAPAFEGSRRPLVADFTFNGHTVTAIDVHSTSRLGSDPLFGSTQPPVDGGDGARTAQATAIKAYVDQLLAADASHNIVVGGDFNGFYFEPALTRLGSNGLTNLNTLIPVEERYSYLFEGNLQQIDNLLATDRLLRGAEFDAVHINTLKTTGEAMATDHDQIVARFELAANRAPVGTADQVAVDEDATTANLYAQLLANDTDADGNALSITGVGTGATLGHVEFDAASRTLRYVADADAFDQLKAGATATDSFTYTVSDGKLTSTATVTVTVTGVEDGVTRGGGNTADTMVGTVGDDRLYGNGGNDLLNGGDGTDFLAGGLGNDVLNGEAGRDYLIGGAGLDTLAGGAGDDYLSGESGNDVMTGGAGADTFAFGIAGGRDTVTDFAVDADTILLAAGVTYQSASVADVNRDGVADLTMVFSNNSSAVLLGVTDVALVHIVTTQDPLMTAAPF